MPQLLPSLYVVGFGVAIPDHITPQARDAVSKCSRVYSIVQEAPSLWLPPERVDLTTVVNALDFYADGAVRSENYRKLSHSIMDDLARGEAIGYVTYGNPMAYDSVAQSLVQEAKKRNLVARVIPGISSVDAILCDLNVDMAPAIQVFEASWLVACGIQPRVDVHTLLLQVGSFGSYRAHYGQRSDGSSLGDLVTHLRGVYSGQHVLSLVRCTSHSRQPALVRLVELQDLCLVSAEELSGASLYIPATESPRINFELMRRMTET